MQINLVLMLFLIITQFCDLETAVSDEADKTSTTNKEKTAEPLKIVAETSFLTSLWQNIVKIFDLTLLKDWTYINILVGFALGQFTAVNFSILTPFIMSDLGLNMSQIATFMSTISVVDVMFRLLSPYIGDYFKRSSREMILLCMLLMICGRQGKNTHF